MKEGLLLTEAPEPTAIFVCFGGDGCRAVFYNQFEYRKHRREAHDEVFEYYLTPERTEYLEYLKRTVTYEAELDKRWINKSASQGLMQAPFSIPLRPKKRYGATEEQLSNMRKDHTCFCGKKFKWPRRKYCSDECYNEWNFKLHSFWDGHKSHFLNSEPYRIPPKESWNYWDTQWFCAKCNKELKEESNVEVDHIIAIVLGGHPWDYRNLQILCEKCHKIKTKSDMGVLAWWKAETKYYDTGLIEDKLEITLEVFFNAAN